MKRVGTVVFVAQNLDFSGANMQLYFLVAGKINQNCVVLCPKNGNFASRFMEAGAVVKVGDVHELINEIHDILCLICNTIMTADIVLYARSLHLSVIWILHEWWDETMLSEQLSLRGMNMTLDSVQRAFHEASKVVFVCEAQRKLYCSDCSKTNSAVIYVGVPSPKGGKNTTSNQRTASGSNSSNINSKGVGSYNQLLKGLKNGCYTNGATDYKYTKENPFIFICIGIICPRKGQKWCVDVFKRFAATHPNCKLVIVGARYTRQYEIDYLLKVKEAAGSDTRIEIHDVTDKVDQYYRDSHCLLFTSSNEVTPLVISEAMSHGLPIISTSIAGIPEMLCHGIEGFLFDVDDEKAALDAMHQVYSNKEFRLNMGANGIKRYFNQFCLKIMIDKYNDLLFHIIPPTILVDMDGVLVDWDAGFIKQWGNKRCPIDRSLSYSMEQCIDLSFKKEAERIIVSQGFFLGLPPMAGGLQAIKDMETAGFKVFICTSLVTHIANANFCAEEKLDWIAKHLGEQWKSKVIFASDKTLVKGEVLIDDKPIFDYPVQRRPDWVQVVFDQPYNRHLGNNRRMHSWRDWFKAVTNALSINLLQQQEQVREMEIVQQQQKKDYQQKKEHKEYMEHKEHKERKNAYTTPTNPNTTANCESLRKTVFVFAAPTLTKKEYCCIVDDPSVCSSTSSSLNSAIDDDLLSVHGSSSLDT